MNSHHHANGVSHARSPLPFANGNPTGNIKPQPADRNAVDEQSEKNSLSRSVNGTASSHPPQNNVMSVLDMELLPAEILEVLKLVSDEAYVPMARLVDREVRTCWSDLVKLLKQSLLNTPIRQPHEVQERLPNDPQSPDDRSAENRLRKRQLFDFAQNHKNALIKLLVILQWSASTQENRATIAFNVYLHQIRAAFSDANARLVQWITYLPSRQDASPDLDTALEILSAGRIASLPNLGYEVEKVMTPKQMLKTLRRLNNLLVIRVLAEDELPAPFAVWSIGDGLLTFDVAQEFDLAVTVDDEANDAPFRAIKVTFKFRPTPVLSEDMESQILGLTNSQISQKGLEGAFRFLHDFTLTLKVQELHAQAISMAQERWAGHLLVSVLRRTLVVQYWATQATKSWLEFTINSGRFDTRGKPCSRPIPYLQLRWMREGKLVDDHAVKIDLAHLSFDNIFNQVVARHTDHIFDLTFERLCSSKLYSNGSLDLDQTSSEVDAFDCGLSVELSKQDKVQLSCDPVSGSLVVSPANDRTTRLQADLSRSKNMVDDLARYFPTMRCAVCQASLLRAMKASSWQHLPGRKPSHKEIQELFGTSVMRATFWRQSKWTDKWMLAATWGLEGDHWWLLFESEPEKLVVQSLNLGPIHLQRNITAEYLDSLSRHAAATIALQSNHAAIQGSNVDSLFPPVTRDKAGMKIHLPNSEKFEVISDELTMVPYSSKRASSEYFIVVEAKLKASQELLSKLAAVGLDASIQVQPGRKLLKLKLSCAIGESKWSTILSRLHFVEDLLNCIKLVDQSPGLHMRHFSLEEIAIDYYKGKAQNLGVALRLGNAEPGSRISLLPEGSNPHSLLGNAISSWFAGSKGALSKNLHALLASLTMTLPLVTCLQYMQGLWPLDEIPQMASLDLTESRKWLRVHVMVREMNRFGVHFYAAHPDFRHQVETSETPERMLARFEIETQVTGPQWIIRPAIEEYKTYVRPSFASTELKERIRDKVWKASSQQWLPLDHGATAMIPKPHHLLLAIHDTILDWVKNNHNHKQQSVSAMASLPVNGQTHTSAETTVHKQAPQKVTQPQGNAGKPMQVQNGQRQLTPQQLAAARQQGMMRQQQQQQSRQGMMNSMQNQVQTNGPSRVMTAEPQPIRQPPGNGQLRRPNGQNVQNRNQQNPQNRQQQPNRPPNPRDVINLD